MIIAFGSPKVVVNELADQHGCSLIVIGTQGQSLLAERALGGVATGIISRAKVPILALPVKKIPGDSNECDKIAWCEFSNHVLYATDFSETSDRAFRYVEQMVAAGVRKVTLLHVQDTSLIGGKSETDLAEFDRLDLERLQVFEQRLRAEGASEISCELRHAIAKQTISEVAAEMNCSLIVMGTQG